MCGLMGVFRLRGERALSVPELVAQFHKLRHRGPDQSRMEVRDDYFVGFHRLAIMDQSPQGMQPFYNHNSEKLLVCNGEIYNFEMLKKEHLSKVAFESSSDCEVLLPLLDKFGLEGALQRIDGEFAFVAFDSRTQTLQAARDPMGIRPLFYGYSTDREQMFFASEAKALTELCSFVEPFPPGSFFDGHEIRAYKSYEKIPVLAKREVDQEILQEINQRLTAAVIKRLHADAPVGFLLSGGLDSSLVCSIAAQQSQKPIRTFAIGTTTDAIDLKYAKQVADFIGSDHHEVMFTMDEVFQALPHVVRHLESWDVTTVRASLGMYLLCAWIKKNTNVRVLLTGEVSDEIFGYKYTDFAPDGVAFQQEAEKRVRELYMYDVLRADRCIAAHGLEARVPFSDMNFVNYVMSIPGEVKLNRYGIGKYLLRQAFAGGKYLPEALLLREKAAFSDAVGHSMVDGLKAAAEKRYSDEAFRLASQRFTHGTPVSKEALWYRELFEECYANRAAWIVDYWLPNRNWKNCNVLDPSARALPNYGASGT
jgi:asparagine synthase (glutamine-hydrolysing)